MWILELCSVAEAALSWVICMNWVDLHPVASVTLSYVGCLSQMSLLELSLLDLS